MEAKEWFEKSEYQYALDEHDEGGYLGIDKNKVAQMLEEYHQTKLKLLGIGGVSQQRELLKKWWKYFDEESVAVNCNDEEREEVITDFFNCG